MELPPELRSALDVLLTALSSKRLAALVTDLSSRYRAGQPAGPERFLRSPEDVEAYAAFRLPATFAAVYAALGQVRGQLPGFRPETCLDVGSGPGTAMWAASRNWPSLKDYDLVESEDAMISFGRRLSEHSSVEAIRAARWHKADILRQLSFPPHDLVIASYVLGELPPDRVAAVVGNLWELTSGTLVIIEPGTPAGFSRIRQYREQLLAAGGQAAAPCPHSRACPIGEDDWCHFVQRIERTRLHRQVKSGELSYEDEKFSFVAVSRLCSEPIPGRVIRHPQVRPGHIRLEICSPEGLATKVVTKKDRDAFRKARDADWGSVSP